MRPVPDAHDATTAAPRLGRRVAAVTLAALALLACGADREGATVTAAGLSEASGDAAAPAATTVRAATPRATSRRAAVRRPPGVPAAWPARLPIGLADREDGAAELRKKAPYGIRWAYLSGGAGGTDSWTRWRTGGGSYATAFVADSRRNGTIPFISYYVLQQTSGVTHLVDERAKVTEGLKDAVVLRAVVADLRLALRRMGEAGRGLAVLQVEPDLWGYAQQAHGDDARKVPVAVRKAGGRLAKGLPNTLAGLAKLVVRLRDREAPSVRLAYPVSIWGTNKDIVGSKPSDDELDTMARRAVRFWRTAGRPFELLTFEYANMTAGYAQHVEGRPAAAVRWRDADYRRHLRFVRDVIAGARRPGLLWQVPPGNDVMAASDDTPGHYVDDKVQRLLGAPARPLLRSMRSAGVIGVLFGSAFPDDTCACDARRDGVTGAQPREGRRAALSADDDGGYLAEQVAAYVRGGALRVTGVPPRRR